MLNSFLPEEVPPASGRRRGDNRIMRHHMGQMRRQKYATAFSLSMVEDLTAG
ncbi:MAG: hypothetical protein ABI876_03700 [Bacteroidota bacterium]